MRKGDVLFMNMHQRQELSLFAEELYRYGVPPHAHQAKVLKYPLNKKFLSLQVLTLRSQLIFFLLGVFIFLKLMGMGGTLIRKDILFDESKPCKFYCFYLLNAVTSLYCFKGLSSKNSIIISLKISRRIVFNGSNACLNSTSLAF